MQKTQNPARLALVMIARDEAKAIARALDSAAGAVDRMIVLDTGSVDQTREIAQRCGAEVYPFTWIDDFAVARNAALAHSEADWNLILDADEWLEGDLSGLGPDILPRNPTETFLGMILIAHQTGDGAYLRGWTPRLLPKGVTYEGRIHEQPNSTLPHRRLTVRIGHDGFLPERRARKAGRNEALLLAELAATPMDGYLWFTLAREHDVAGRALDATFCYASALRLTDPLDAFRHRLVVRAITAFKEAGRFDDAVKLANQEIDNWEDSPDFFFALGDLYLELAVRNPAAALATLLPVAENAWKRCLEIGERDDLDGSIAGRGSHMAAHNLAVCYEALGKADLAEGYLAMANELRAKAA